MQDPWKPLDGMWRGARRAAPPVRPGHGVKAGLVLRRPGASVTRFTRAPLRLLSAARGQADIMVMWQQLRVPPAAGPMRQGAAYLLGVVLHLQAVTSLFAFPLSKHKEITGRHRSSPRPTSLHALAPTSSRCHADWIPQEPRWWQGAAGAPVGPSGSSGCPAQPTERPPWAADSPPAAR